jgi:glutaredoxin
MENMLPLSPADVNLIMRHKEIITGPVKIRLVYDDSDAGSKMNSFCLQLEQLLPVVRVVRETADEELPGIHVSGNLHFMMVPKNAYLEGFLLALLGNDALAAQEVGVAAGELQKHAVLPALMKVYITRECPFCKKVLPKILFLAGAAPAKIDLTIIDVMLFKELAKEDNIRSAPTTIMDDQFRWSGDFEVAEIIGMLAGRNPSQLGHDTLKKMIGDGNAEGVATLMDEFNIVIPAFPELLMAQKWTHRLGAMVAFEYLVEKNPAIAQNVIDILWDRFESLDTPVMGDVLHLFGVFNQSSQVPRLQSVLSGQYPESVKKVAKEIFDGMAAQDSA